METLTIDKVGTELKSVYGGQDVIFTYDVTHTNYGYTNYYTAQARIRDLGEGQIELEFFHVDEVEEEDTNEETLTSEAILDRLNDKVQM